VTLALSGITGEVLYDAHVPVHSLSGETVWENGDTEDTPAPRAGELLLRRHGARDDPNLSPTPLPGQLVIVAGDDCRSIDGGFIVVKDAEEAHNRSAW
jgi:hypothetical protein